MTTQSNLKKKILLDIDLLMLILDKVGDGVVLTDPNLKKKPIIYASAGFYELTGYTEKEVLGRNCNFLQSKGTSPEVIAEIRNAILLKKSFKGKVLNYKKNGEPFLNLLRIEPIFQNVRLKYYLGSQINYLI